MYALVEGKPGLVFVDGNKRIRIVLGFGKNDEPVLDFYDEEGKPRIK